MSVSLTVRWVFGYHCPDDDAYGLDYDEYPDFGCNVESVECMGGNSGSLIFAAASQVVVLNDRNGYKFDRPVFTMDNLPPSEPFVESLKRFMEEYLPEACRPKEAPRWILHTDMG